MTTSASFAASVPRAEIELPGRDAREDRDDRQDEEGERHAGREDERRAEDVPPYVDDLGTGRKPAFLSAVWPLADSSMLIQARAAALFGDVDTTAIS